MITKESVHNMAGHVFKHAKGIRDKRAMHPVREWFFGLGAFLIIVCAGGVYSAHTFLQYKHTEVIEGKFDKTVATYNTVLAEKALVLYTKRRNDFFALQQSATPVVPDDTEEAVVASSTPDILEVEEEVGTSTVELAN